MRAFEYWKSDKDGKWYFHLKASNGEIVCASQGYSSKQGCLKGISVVKLHSIGSKIIEVDEVVPTLRPGIYYVDEYANT